MLQQNVGKNIAILFYARACALRRTLAVTARACTIAFACGICSTGLTNFIYAAAKVPPRIVENTTQSVNLETIKPIKILRVIRTNVANSAFEELSIQEKSAIVKRSTGLQKTMALEEGAFQAIESKIRALGMFEPKFVKPLDGVKVEIAIKTQDGESRFDIDPAGRIQACYADLMNLRNKVLSDGK